MHRPGLSPYGKKLSAEGFEPGLSACFTGWKAEVMYGNPFVRA